jgi:hypothetical protein
MPEYYNIKNHNITSMFLIKEEKIDVKALPLIKENPN